MAKLSYLDAIRDALFVAMEQDDNVFVLGEDVGKKGGVFKVTEGLQEKFGEMRVLDTPLAESNIVGTSVGAAMMGKRPVAEIQFAEYILPAVNQILNEAAKIRYRSDNDWNAPMVIRAPYGGGIHGALYHSQSIESLFVSTPGLKVVVPSTPYDAKGLLISSIRDNDPVIFLEHLKLYRSFREEVPEESYTIPLGKADVKREGTDLTIIAYGLMVHESLKAAEELEKEGHSVEVIDLRTIQPLDIETIIASVEKTNRAIVVQEAQKQAGIAANVVAEITERAILSLEAPVLRVAAPDTIYPFPQAEGVWLPTYKDVYETAKKVLTF